MLSVESRKSLESAAARYEANLVAANHVLSYLANRGIPLDVARRYRLGVVDAECRVHGEEHKGKLAIPYLARAGVVSFAFRDLYSDGSFKYMTPYPKRLYNTLAMDQADRDGTLGIAEGELDALIATEYVGIPTVGIPGAETYKAHPEWKELFRGYQQVIVFQDTDPKPSIRKDKNGEEYEYWPGRELAKQLRSDIDVARIIKLPAKDVNATYLEFGAEAIREAAGLA